MAPELVEKLSVEDLPEAGAWEVYEALCLGSETCPSSTVAGLVEGDDLPF